MPEGPGISEAIAKKTEPQDGGASRVGRELSMLMILSRELRVPSVLVDAISSSRLSKVRFRVACAISISSSSISTSPSTCECKGCSNGAVQP